MSKLKLNDSGEIEIVNQDEKAKLYFYGDIVGEKGRFGFEDDKCPTDIIQFLKELDGAKQIEEHFNSGGGNVFAGLAIKNEIKAQEAETHGYVDGIAASTASFLFMSCDKLFMPRDSMIMIHKPSTACYGNTEDFKKEISILEKTEELIINCYMDKAKEHVSREQIIKMMEEETWLTGEEAAEYFNITVTEAAGRTACTSKLLQNYKNLPEKYREFERETLVKEIADEIEKRLQNKTKLKEEKRMQEILNDLDYI